VCQAKITGSITMSVEDLKCSCGCTQIIVGASPTQYRGASYAKSCYIASGYIKCKECDKILAEFASR